VVDITDKNVGMGRGDAVENSKSSVLAGIRADVSVSNGVRLAEVDAPRQRAEKVSQDDGPTPSTPAKSHDLRDTPRGLLGARITFAQTHQPDALTINEASAQNETSTKIKRSSGRSQLENETNARQSQHIMSPFIDADQRKRQLRENLAQGDYSVFDYYHKTGFLNLVQDVDMLDILQAIL
jgi:hypothetical protein